MSKQIIVVVSILSLLVLLTAISYLQNVWGKSRQIVSLKQGETMRLEFERDHPRPVESVSLVLKTVDNSDPFANYDVPLTIEVFEKNQLVGSESFTAEVGADYKKVHVDVNNDPMIKGNFKIAIRFDVPEFGSDDNRLLINVDSVKFNDGKVNMHQHGDIKLIPAS
ncbi:MAG TPA: hypothetical protein VF884_14870 [Nitrososphaeraceae archaeon]